VTEQDATLGSQVMHTVKRIRERRNMRFTELADRLATLGQPIPVLGLRRIEKGERRVDADELVALAVALEVHPASLLMPLDQSTLVKVAGHTTTTWEALKWFAGDGPWPDGDSPDAEAFRTLRDLFRDHDRHLGSYRVARDQWTLAQIGLDPNAPPGVDPRQEALEHWGREAYAAEVALADVRKRLRQAGVTPPAITDPRLAHLEGGSE
jgi:transcriptional regulator with XRE-family HTH domain